MLEMTIQEKQALRRKVALAIYEISDGHSSGALWNEIVAKLDVDEADAEIAVDYLVRERVVDEGIGLGYYALTHKGVKEIEEAILHPNKATEHFPAAQFNININGNQVVGQGNQVSQFNVLNSPDELKQFAELLQKADGGSLSPESSKFLSLAQEGASNLILAAAAEQVADKGEDHKLVLDTLKTEITKKIAEKSVDGAIHGVGWLYEHGPQVLAALNLYFGSR